MQSPLRGTSLGAWTAKLGGARSPSFVRHPAWSDPRGRVLAVVIGGVALLHRDGLAVPKAVYLVIVAASILAAIPTLRAVRADPERSDERNLVLAAGAFGLIILVSLAVAHAHGTGQVAWTRDASVYGLLVAAPLLALDLRRAAGPRWVSWLLVASGVTCAVSFVVHWLTLREYASLPVDRILLPSLYLPVGLFAYATARALRADGRGRAAWWGLAAAIGAGVAVTGSRTVLVLIVAPVVQLALCDRRRTVVITLVAAVLAIALGLAAGHWLGSSSGIARLTSVKTFLVHPGRDPSWRERVEESTDALHVWRGSPILGVGPGHSFHWHNFYGVPESSFLIDSPAGLLAKFGILGVAVLVLFAVALGVFLRNRLRAYDERRIGAEALLGFCAIACCGLVLGIPMEDKGFPLAFLLLTGLTLPGRADPVVSRGHLQRRAIVVAAAVLAGLVAAAIAGGSARSVVSDKRQLQEILKAPLAPKSIVTDFENALVNGDGRLACGLVTPAWRARFRTMDRCVKRMSTRAKGDQNFIGSHTYGPFASKSVQHAVRFVVRRRNGAAAIYIVRRVQPGRWRIGRLTIVEAPGPSK